MSLFFHPLRGSGFKYILILGGILILIIGGIKIWIHAEDSSPSPYSAPLIKPDYETFKIKAAHSGDTHILHQDKEVYHQFVPRSTSPEREEGLASPSEEPLTSFPEPSLPPPSFSSSEDPVALESLNSSFLSSAETTAEPWADIFETLLETDLSTLEQNPSSYAVYLPPFETKDVAQMEWKRLRGIHADLLNLLPLNIIKQMHPTGKIYFQLQIGPFKTQTEANSLCLSLKNRGSLCRVHPCLQGN